MRLAMMLGLQDDLGVRTQIAPSPDLVHSARRKAEIRQPCIRHCTSNNLVRGCSADCRQLQGMTYSLDLVLYVRKASMLYLGFDVASPAVGQLQTALWGRDRIRRM